ncbi:hypothetical protein Y027_5858 [Burkholderia pseudomallei TSV5]|nr:hypothetical protein X989_5896 [Burkholderia pseudomallei MSHR4378]KGS34714.1 hypothetical protein X945_5990 [Burkholderia pseudomallei ABCPW 107]KGX48965.1 hypothetical protein Y025_5756 [Burkholderia pseudomallei TSV32]KGX49032.1 hypothetical protein Y027_5858 [Burkholderia pseudomallei TSV5]
MDVCLLVASRKLPGHEIRSPDQVTEPMPECLFERTKR